MAKTDVQAYALCLDPLRVAGRGCLLGDPQGVEVIGVGCYTSVTASRMTDAYGASTPVGVQVMEAPEWYKSQSSHREEKHPQGCPLHRHRSSAKR